MNESVSEWVNELLGVKVKVRVRGMMCLVGVGSVGLNESVSK